MFDNSDNAHDALAIIGDTEWFGNSKAGKPSRPSLSPQVPVQAFLPDLYAGRPTLEPLDLSDKLRTTGPASSPGLCTNFARILPGGADFTYQAGPDGAASYLVHDAPMLRRLGSRGDVQLVRAQPPSRRGDPCHAGEGRQERRPITQAIVAMFGIVQPGSMPSQRYLGAARQQALSAASDAGAAPAPVGGTRFCLGLRPWPLRAAGPRARRERQHREPDPAFLGRGHGVHDAAGLLARAFQLRHRAPATFADPGCRRVDLSAVARHPLRWWNVPAAGCGLRPLRDLEAEPGNDRLAFARGGPSEGDLR